MKNKILLKDILFNKEKVQDLAIRINKVWPEFESKDFVDEVVKDFPSLELKSRISWIAECLKKYLPDNYEYAVGILLNSLPPPNNPDLSDNDFGDFIYASFGDFVAKNGCNQKFLTISLNALYRITQSFSAEDAIRYFINSFPEKTLKALELWSEDTNYHVRRLCSEGTRPTLPWSQKITIDTTAPIKILDKLYCDKTRYVTRSVANHINDISKLNPSLAITTLKKWRASKKQTPDEMSFILNHGLRTLIKNGIAEAFELLGFSSTIKAEIRDINLPSIVKLGSFLNFSFLISAVDDAEMLIDYLIYFNNKGGILKNKKVYKLKKITVKKNEITVVEKKHLMKKDMSTRVIYPGKHALEIQINGKSYAKKYFEIVI